MRKALMTTGILGGAMVLAIALVAVMVLRSGGSPSKPSQAAGFTSATGASSSPTASPSAKASTSAKPKKTAKPSASPKASKTAKSNSASTHTSTSAAPSSLTVPAGWKLAFDPGFSGSSLSSTWSTCYDWATSASAGCTNNPSTEKEWYLPSQVQVSGGVLNLTAKQETTQGQSSSGAAQTYACRSGMVSSKPGFSFTYGLIQVTAKLPYGPGLWPALWLAATNDQWPPELDIMEHWYSEQDYKIYDHTVGTSYVGGPVPTPVNLSAGFHTYSLLWTKDRVTWYLDGVEKFTTTDHVPQQAMYFIANVADRIPDGNTNTSIAPGDCTGTMQIQSVKVWQP
jgi:beta-glucanase (GH16 family)